MGKAGFLCVIFLSLTAAAGLAQEHSLFGDVRLLTAFHHADNPVQDAGLPWFGLADWQTAELGLEADQRLTWNSLQFRVHHDLALDQEGLLTYRLFEAYLAFTPADRFTIVIGKNHLSWGTSYFFIPSDKLNPVSADPTAARRDEGFPGISVTLTPDADFTLTAAVSFAEALDHTRPEYWKDFRYGLIASALLGGLNLKASCVYQIDRVLRPGLELSADLAGFVIYAEAAVELYNNTLYPTSPTLRETPEPLTLFFLGDAGVQRTFTADDLTISVSLEYFYTDTGFSAREEDWFFEGLDLGVTTVSDYLGKHYLFAAAGLELTNVFSTDHSLVINLQDGSVFFWHRITLLAIENCDLYCEILWTAGNATTEFGAAGERFRLTAGTTVYF